MSGLIPDEFVAEILGMLADQSVVRHMRQEQTRHMMVPIPSRATFTPAATAGPDEPVAPVVELELVRRRLYIRVPDA